MKTLLMLIALFSASISYAQEVINTTLTDEHQQIKGSKIFMVPPDSFAVATQFQGFQDADRSASLLIAILKAPAPSLIAAFTKEALKGQGVNMLKREEITFNGMPGLLITGNQEAYDITFNKYVLVFGDASFTALINGMYPKEDAEELDELVLKAIKSTVYVDEADANPLGALSFTINSEGTKLQFATIITGSALYSADGNVPSKTDDKATFLVSQSLSPSIILDEQDFCIKRLKQTPYQDIAFSEADITELTVDELHGYTIQATAVDPKGKEARYIYQTMLFDGEGNYFVLFGTAHQDDESNALSFEKLTKSFKRK